MATNTIETSLNNRPEPDSNSDSELTVLACSEIDAMEVELSHDFIGGSGDDVGGDDEVVAVSHDVGDSEVYMTRFGRIYNPF